MRRLIPIFLATVCAVAIFAGPAQAQRGGRGGGYHGNYYGGYYGNYGWGGYYYSPRSSYYGGYNTPYYGGYYYPQYSYGYRYPRYYTTTPYASDTIVYNTTPQQTTSNYGADPNASAQTWFRVILPDPMARLTIQDQITRSTGAERVFYTPILERGKTYAYTLRASWMESGAEVTRERKIDVMAGQNLIINFADRNAAIEAVPHEARLLRLAASMSNMSVKPPGGIDGRIPES